MCETGKNQRQRMTTNLSSKNSEPLTGLEGVPKAVVENSKRLVSFGFVEVVGLRPHCKAINYTLDLSQSMCTHSIKRHNLKCTHQVNKHTRRYGDFSLFPLQ